MNAISIKNMAYVPTIVVFIGTSASICQYIYISYTGSYTKPVYNAIKMLKKKKG